LAAIAAAAHRGRRMMGFAGEAMTQLPIMTLVHGDDGGHARGSGMPRDRHLPVLGLRTLGIVTAAWAVVTAFSELSLYIRISSGEIRPAAGWFWTNLAVWPIWTVLSIPILWLSRRVPFERRTWRTSVAAHAVALVAVLALDGLINLRISPGAGKLPLTFWQQMWRYSFIDLFLYAGIVAVEHAGRYYALYVDRRLRASELEAQVSRAQLQALQMQIRPHFLFNALNTISGLVRTDDKAAATTMLAGLGDLLRLLLRSDGAQEVPVHQELELIERYLQIEQVRFGDKLAVEVHVQPGVEDALVPNLILQPLVENAVRHGIGATTGRVSVDVQRIGETLRMEVRDTGDAQPRERDSLGIGLTNTRARLARLYGDVHRFELAQHAAGTSAIIEIPLHRAPGGTA
jgi:two-component sensor histidine kinase